MIRIIAGEAKGRKIKVPTEADTRPTTDRAREAIFNSIYQLDEAPKDCRVLDLFAGSGALGIEALSRGANHATFVDHSKDAIKTVHSNLNGLGFREKAELVRFDALKYLKTPDLNIADSFDIIFLDPPFALPNWQELLELVVGANVIVIGASHEIEVDGSKWETIKAAKHASTYIKVCKKTS